MRLEVDQANLELLLSEAALSTKIYEDDSRKPSFYSQVNLRDYRLWAVNNLSELLRLPGMQEPASRSELRLRVALHFSPPEAIEFSPERPESRNVLIEEYIRSHFSFPSDSVGKLARSVAVVLDNWDANRKPGLGGRRHRLLEKQGNRCNSCKLPLNDTDRINIEEDRSLEGTSDPFKPYFDGGGVEDSMRPVVDHIAVVSKDGTNLPDNLQVLCTLCNTGKGDSSGIRASKELEHSCREVNSIPRGHRMRMMYYRMQMDKFRCVTCNSDKNELTIRKVRVQGAFILTNLITVCYQCLDAQG